MSFPIIIRNFNRYEYLDITLKSLLGCNLPNDVEIIIYDDCSTDVLTNKYLSTNDILEQKFANPEWKKWEQFIGNIPITPVVGIKDKFEIIKPDTKKGVRGAIFWLINYAMNRFNVEAVHIVEADVVFHKDWYKVAEDGYNICKNQKGPNGDYIGLFSAYDRECIESRQNYGWTWRSYGNTSYGNGHGIGGCHYIASREFYNRARKSFEAKYDPKLKSGDTELKKLCAKVNCNIAVTIPSMIQHVGLTSTAWPEKNNNWRYSKGFKKPFVWRRII